MPNRVRADQTVAPDVLLSPVEQGIADLLSEELGPDALDQLHRYQRKIDITRKLVQRYVGGFGAAASDLEISGHSYRVLAHVFTERARRERGGDEHSRSRLLRYVNSAFHCLDRAGDFSDSEGTLQELDRLAMGASL